MKSLVLTGEIIKQHLSKDKFFLHDGGGLYLSKRSSNAEPVFLCRFKIDGKIKTRTLGSYSNLTLSQARAERDVIKKEMKSSKSKNASKNAKHAHENAFNNNNNEIIQPTLNFDFQPFSATLQNSVGRNIPTIKFGGYFDIDVFANFLKLVIDINTAYIKSILQALTYLYLPRNF